MGRSMGPFASVAAFEWRYQLKSPVFWVGCLLFFLLTFGATTVDEIQIGSRGNVNINSPFAIVQTLATLSVFAVFVVVALVAGPVLRDDETGFAPILRSTRIGKTAYLGGRFFGACAVALLVLAAVPLANAVGSLMPWLDAEKIGPFNPGHYLWALFVFGLPTVLITGALFFALATATRSMMWTYIGAVALLTLFFVTRSLLRDLQYDTVAALSDPFGLSALGILTKYWTAADRNTRLPEVGGLLLANRALWLGLAAAAWAVAWRVFRFESRGSQRSATTPAEADRRAPAARSGPLPAPRSDRTTRWAQFVALARFDMGHVFRSPAFVVLLAMGVLNAGGSMVQVGQWYGSGSYPVTRLMVQVLQGAFSIMPIIIAIYYGGELVWRDRERRVHEMLDATAAPDWAHLVPKIAAVAGVLAATALVGTLTGMTAQLLRGYTQLEPGRYLLWFILPTVIASLQLAVLSIFVQVLVPQKFLGWGVMLVYLVASVAMAGAGFEHNLYNYAGTPPVPLSDMGGMDRFWIGPAWFQLYWSAAATVLAVLAYALWRRGSVTALRPRLAQLRRRLRGPALALTAGALAVFGGSGAFIFYNTNVLHRYASTPEREALLAEAERTLMPFENLPMPRVTGVTLDVQLYPRQTRAVTRGRYQLTNRSAQPIEQMHLSWSEWLTIDELELPGATVLREYPRFNHRVYQFKPALQPGQTRELRFATTLQEKGFANGAGLTRIVANGTFIDNGDIEPAIGILRRGFLTDRAKRRKYGLPAELRLTPLEDERGRERNIISPASDWVDADITVTTDADQTPIAPGDTVSDTVKDGRRTVHFKPDAPINHFFSIQSARYAVQRDTFGPVQLAVYHQPGHDANVGRMLAAMKASLKLFGEQFSPYQFRQARILEFPSYADFAQSFANTIPYSENLGFLTRLTDPDKIDVVTYITAHEIAHQWWGHQLAASEQQGATMLIETFAQYSALLVMERLYGREHMRRFLKYELDRYLRDRGGEAMEETPLARVENQPYIHYRKGSLAMYWLKEVVGEPVVNRALADLLQAYALKAAPYPNTRDFLQRLRAQAGPAHDALITDLFEHITLLDLKATAARSERLPDGRYQVSFEVDAHKFHADGQGRETEAPLDEPVDIGVFSAEPGSTGFTSSAVLLFERHGLRSGRQTVKLVVEREPRWVGVDPYNKRIDRNSADNLALIQTK
jgi:ABC-2 type transport system permease protein